MNRNDLQLVFVILLILAAIAIIINVQHKKRRTRKMFEAIRNTKVNVPIADFENPLSYAECTILDSNYMINKVMQDDLQTDWDMLKKPVVLYNHEEINKRQQVLSLVQAVVNYIEDKPGIGGTVFKAEFISGYQHIKKDDLKEFTEEQKEAVSDVLAVHNGTMNEEDFDKKYPEPETPEDYFSQFVLVDGKWIKKPSK